MVKEVKYEELFFRQCTLLFILVNSFHTNSILVGSNNLIIVGGGIVVGVYFSPGFFK